TDQYRLCVVNSSGFRVDRVLRAAGAAAPTEWNSAACQWEVERVGDGLIRLRNASLQLTHPYTEYLACAEAASSCVFNYDASGAGNTTFRVNTAGQNLCTGVVCPATDQCHAPGVCYPLSGLCSDPVLPVGTACDDGDSALTGDTCSSGVCINGGDSDGDGVRNAIDLCIGDDATGDTDSDDRCDDSDNCPTVANVSQLDGDEDGIGNVCDNCPATTATSQADADSDGVGDVCDPDFRPTSSLVDPGPTYTNPARPACGFTPVCPIASGATKFNSYLFGCYADEPNGGLNCLGDRWYHHLSRRIYPALLTTTAAGTVDGTLNELAKPENNVPATACTTTADCVSPATCLGNVCTMPAVADFIERLSASSNFLSCTGPDSYENTWPTARVVPLETGPCDPIAEYNRPYGYRVSNTTSEPMTIWVTKARGEPGRWWTINGGEEIRFNVFGS
ncbi:MAG: thrombospondin type 3 repeat-containing protein, partial [Myxococcales bacterium]|nr:thrombospondin type 3 repeat-containing protein [Myxococcales bacterium]